MKVLKLEIQSNLWKLTYKNIQAFKNFIKASNKF